MLQCKARPYFRFKALEPDTAALLEKAFGSPELATLMIIGRINDQPSFLEKLAQERASNLNVDFSNYLELGPDFVAQVKSGLTVLKRGESTEHKIENQEKLSQRLDRARKNYELELVGIFKKLEEADPEVASAVLGLWKELVKTAEFVITPAKALAGKSPLKAIEEGRRQEN